VQGIIHDLLSLCEREPQNIEHLLPERFVFLGRENQSGKNFTRVPIRLMRSGSMFVQQAHGVPGATGPGGKPRVKHPD
jgi:hypothetical protein